MKGTIYKSTGSWYSVKGEDGAFYKARLKGKFKIEGITSTNPIAVGDEVAFDMEDELENRVMITDLFPRRNYVNRISPANRRMHHIIASNLDQSLLVATLKDPRTSVVSLTAFWLPAKPFIFLPSCCSTRQIFMGSRRWRYLKSGRPCTKR
jgi:ribosome biogenesis GTPase